MRDSRHHHEALFRHPGLEWEFVGAGRLERLLMPTMDGLFVDLCFHEVGIPVPRRIAVPGTPEDLAYFALGQRFRGGAPKGTAPTRPAETVQIRVDPTRALTPLYRLTDAGGALTMSFRTARPADEVAVSYRHLGDWQGRPVLVDGPTMALGFLAGHPHLLARGLFARFGSLMSDIFAETRSEDDGRRVTARLRGEALREDACRALLCCDSTEWGRRFLADLRSTWRSSGTVDVRPPVNRAGLWRLKCVRGAIEVNGDGREALIVRQIVAAPFDGPLREIVLPWTGAERDGTSTRDADREEVSQATVPVDGIASGEEVHAAAAPDPGAGRLRVPQASRPTWPGSGVALVRGEPQPEAAPQDSAGDRRVRRRPAAPAKAISHAERRNKASDGVAQGVADPDRAQDWPPADPLDAGPIADRLVTMPEDRLEKPLQELIAATGPLGFAPVRFKQLAGEGVPLVRVEPRWGFPRVDRERDRLALCLAHRDLRGRFLQLIDCEQRDLPELKSMVLIGREDWRPFQGQDLLEVLQRSDEIWRRRPTGAGLLVGGFWVSRLRHRRIEGAALPAFHHSLQRRLVERMKRFYR